METEKQTITINYEGSGVKTLNGISYLFLTFSIISLLGCLLLIPAYNNGNESFLSLILIFLTSFFGLLAAYGICKSLSTITRTALYQRMIIEQQYDIKVEEEKSLNNQ